MFYATTTIKIDRSTPGALDVYLEPFDDFAIPVEASTPASITEYNRRVWNPETLEARVERMAHGRVYLTVSVKKGDRWTDLRSGRRYLVDVAAIPGDAGLVGHANMSVELRLLGDS